MAGVPRETSMVSVCRICIGLILRRNSKAVGHGGSDDCCRVCSPDLHPALVAGRLVVDWQSAGVAQVRLQSCEKVVVESGYIHLPDPRAPPQMPGQELAECLALFL
ncbi:hypothetical protein BH23CHL2_BH23CHL2_23770 [soil metagenome]